MCGLMRPTHVPCRKDSAAAHAGSKDEEEAGVLKKLGLHKLKAKLLSYINLGSGTMDHSVDQEAPQRPVKASVRPDATGSTDAAAGSAAGSVHVASSPIDAAAASAKAAIGATHEAAPATTATARAQATPGAASATFDNGIKASYDSADECTVAVWSTLDISTTDKPTLGESTLDDAGSEQPPSAADKGNSLRVRGQVEDADERILALCGLACACMLDPHACAYLHCLACACMLDAHAACMLPVAPLDVPSVDENFRAKCWPGAAIQPYSLRGSVHAHAAT
jgi:hypothetical protein